MYIRNTSTYGTILTEYLPNVGRRLPASERARQSHGTGKHKKEKKQKLRKEVELDLCPVEEAIKEGSFLHLGSPSPAGKSTGTEGKRWSLGGERSNWFEAARMERNLYMRSVPSLYTPQPETRGHQCGQGLGAEAWALEIGPGEGTGVGYEQRG